jgi:DNA-binding MarR family transcriptional regulator
MSSTDPRDELKAALLRTSRRVGGQATLWSQAVAERLGLAGIDVECLDLLLTEGSATVGHLAELTGLTTGSATRMVDRLEQAGFVRRFPDPADRRRVLVEVVPGVEAKLGALHDSFHGAQTELIERYSDDQLRLLADFMTQFEAVMKQETAKMRAPSGGEDEGGSYAAPIGGVTRGRLIFVSGAPKISVRGDATLKELYRASFEGPVPRMRVRDGIVTVHYPRLGWLDWRTQIAGQTIDASGHWRKDRGEIALNPAIPWAIELRGGVSKLSVDARVLRLESFELRGGASQVSLTLPAPLGVVPISVRGGMNNIEIERPEGAAMVLELHGGVNQAVVDGEAHTGRGQLSLQTPGADQAPNRYEIDVSGGIGKVVVTTR